MTKRVVKVGDLIRIVDWRGGEPDSRDIGTVLRLSQYKTSQKMKYGATESLSEILWNDGKIGWILTDRLMVIGEEDWKD